MAPAQIRLLSSTYDFQSHHPGSNNFEFNSDLGALALIVSEIWGKYTFSIDSTETDFVILN